jgi:hypothetical protein
MSLHRPRLVAAVCIVFTVAVFGLVAFNVGWPLLIVFALVVPCAIVDLVLIVRGRDGTRS